MVGAGECEGFEAILKSAQWPFQNRLKGMFEPRQLPCSTLNDRR